MSCSRPLPPFTYDVLRYLNREQLERFSIVCHPLKNFINRYFNSKPYRIFDDLEIRGSLYALFKDQEWLPLAGQNCSMASRDWHDWAYEYAYYSFVEMRPFLGPTVRVKRAVICVGKDFIYNPEQIEQMESIAYLWRERKIRIANGRNVGAEIALAEDFQPILNSPIILQCQHLEIINAHLSFKDYNVLYTVNVIEALFDFDFYFVEIDWQYWQQFLEKPRVKPIVVLRRLGRENIDDLLDCLKEAFSSAISPNPFKIVFAQYDEELTEFRETNLKSREMLELKKGLPTEYQPKDLERYKNYTLERSNI